MAYAIEIEGTDRLAATLNGSSTQLKDDAEALAYAAGIGRRGVGEEDPVLTAAFSDFVLIHTVGLETISGGVAALGRKVRYVAQSSRHTELLVAQSLGQVGGAAPSGSDGLAL